MNPLLRGTVLGIVISGFATPALATTCAPQTLVHITIVNVTPGIAPGSFNAQPKTLYRIGNDKMRIEEAPDQANGIHGVVVVAEPNIWLANLYDNTGKHAIDPGPTFNAKAPVFGVTSLPAKLLDLEFGCEASYIAANAPKAARSEPIGDKSFAVYRVEVGTDAVEILELPGTGIPTYARYYHQGRLAIMLRYDLYLTGIANDASLFLPPAGVHYVEVSTLKKR